MNTPPRMYNIGLLNDLHYHFPDLLYRPERFESVQDILRYIGEVASQNPYERNREAYLRTHSQGSSSSPTRAPSRVARASTHSSTSSRPSYVSPLSSFFGGGLPVSSNIRINLPVSSASTASSSSSTLGDQLISSLLGGLSEQRNGSSNLADFYFQILQQNIDPDSSVPTQDEIHHATTIPSIHDHIEGVCSICQDSYSSDGTTCRRIDHCGHIFHRSCIDTWFQTHSTCPMCRYDIRQS